MPLDLQSLEAPARVEAIVTTVVDALEIEATVNVTVDEDGGIMAEVEGDDVGRLIGRRGHTIDALQMLCYRAAQRGSTERIRVAIDASGYRRRRRELIEQQADRAADRARETGNEIELEPMSASERKIVHDRLAERDGIETFSEGDEPERCVIVAPVDDD